MVIDKSTQLIYKGSAMGWMSKLLESRAVSDKTSSTYVDEYGMRHTAIIDTDQATGKFITGRSLDKRRAASRNRVLRGQPEEQRRLENKSKAGKSVRNKYTHSQFGRRILYH